MSLYALTRELCARYSPEEVRRWREREWPALEEMFEAFEEMFEGPSDPQDAERWYRSTFQMGGEIRPEGMNDRDAGWTVPYNH